MSIEERLVPGTDSWNRYYYEHEQRYLTFAHLCTGRIVLDIACGVGYGTHILARLGARKLIGIDRSREALNIARTEFSHPDIEFVQSDAINIPVNDHSFDTVISFETIEHLDAPELFLKEISRVLKPDGHFVCSTPNKEFISQIGSVHSNPYHVSEMSYPEFCGNFSEYFEIAERFYQTHSAQYLRYLTLVREIEHLNKVVKFSKMLALENKLRRLFGRVPLKVRENAFMSDVGSPLDFDIRPFEIATNHMLTFILVGRRLL